jgi:DNA-binding CsgD family transcriptional regulator
MLGLEISIAPIIISLEVLYLIYQLIYSISVEFKNRGAKRIILLNLSFLAYNMFYILGVTKSIDVYVNNGFLILSGAFLTSMSTMYVANVFDLVEGRKQNLTLQLALFFGALPLSYLSVHFITITEYGGVLDPTKEVPNISVLIISILILLGIAVTRSSSEKVMRLKRFLVFFVLLNAFSFPLYLKAGHIEQMLILNQFFLIAGGYQLMMQSKFSNAIYSKLSVTPVIESSTEQLQELLTQRQLEVAELMIEGYSFKEIEHELNISYNTVTKHASDIYDKMNCKGQLAFNRKYGAKQSIKTNQKKNNYGI